MKSIKSALKILSLLLVVALLATMVTLPVMAEGETEADEVEYAKEMLRIYGDSFTEYIPLDAYGSVQNKKESNIIINWESSDEGVVSTSGKVYPAVGEEKNVILTATLTNTKTGKTATKEFSVTIPAVAEYVIEGVKLAGDDGIIDTQLVAGKKIEKVSVKHYGDAQEDITIVTALYDENKKLTDVKTEVVMPQIPSQSHGDITLTNPLTLPGDVTGHSAKVMLLNRKDEKNFLSASYTVNSLSDNITVYIVGDSLAADYPEERHPLGGWGSYIDDYIDGITVDNIAESGMSSKSFIAGEEKLPYLESNLKEGDYIFFMFGHNDQKVVSLKTSIGGSEEPKFLNRHTGIGSYGILDGDTLSYFGYISEIVKVARKKKANIVLFTQFNRAQRDTANLNGYPDALKVFANEQNIPVIDTTTLSLNLYNRLYDEGEKLGINADSFAKNIFMFLTEKDPRYDWTAYPDSEYITGKSDATHFNLFGASVRAKLAVLGLVGANNALARFENVTEADFNALCESVIADILATEYYGKAN